MAVLGLSGLFSTEEHDYDPVAFSGFYHDAAACLVAEGRVLAAIEEERLNRDKHTNRFPGLATRACLDACDMAAGEISHIAYFFEENFTDDDIARVAVADPRMPLAPARDLIYERLEQFLGVDLRNRPISFVEHHRTHAASAFFDSGMSSALVITCDGNGERDGISVYHGEQGELRLLRSYPREHSLGQFYTLVTKILGFRDFDEYKVMGLAPFGDPSRYRDLFTPLYNVDTCGRYQLALDKVLPTLQKAGFRPRRSHDPLVDKHRDLAAAAQELLETVCLRLIQYWLTETGCRDLCHAGGVAQNTSLNGKILSLTGLDRVYVPPAAHDAGGALGAAMLVEHELDPARNGKHYSTNAYLGRSLGNDDQIRARLEAWDEFIEFERPEQLEATVAEAIANDAVVGWVKGRAEFGPRALGNRSILADPRCASNKDRVNGMIKQREGFRPFAPVVTEQDAERFFELSETPADHSYMGFVVPVRREWHSGLGAITHVDGTARLQTLRQEQNHELWKVLKEFEGHTGVPVLLNTSFNNHAEPIVDSIDDAVATFITTGLSLLAAGPFLVRRKECMDKGLREARVELMPFCQTVHTTARGGQSWWILRTAQPRLSTPVSAALQRFLADGGRVSDLELSSEQEGELLHEIKQIWNDRLVRIIPD